MGQVTGPFTDHSWPQVRGISGHQPKVSKKQFQNTFKYSEKMPKGGIIFLGCLLPLLLPFLSASSLQKLFHKLEVSSSLFPPFVFFPPASARVLSQGAHSHSVTYTPSPAYIISLILTTTLEGGVILPHNYRGIPSPRSHRTCWHRHRMQGLLDSSLRSSPDPLTSLLSLPAFSTS